MIETEFLQDAKLQLREFDPGGSFNRGFIRRATIDADGRVVLVEQTGLDSRRVRVIRRYIGAPRWAFIAGKWRRVAMSKTKSFGGMKSSLSAT